MVLDEYAWEEDKAIFYLGIAMTIGGILSMGCYLAINKLVQRFE